MDKNQSQNKLYEVYEVIRQEANNSNTIIVQPINKADHKHTFIWIHGLNYNEQSNLNDLIQSFSEHLGYLKIIIPRAPVRFVTLSNKEVTSWFDIKFRGKKSFQVDFDQAFSTLEVNDSYQRILKPIIQKEKAILRGLQQSQIQSQNKQHQVEQHYKNIKHLLIVGGFSQGCGMSLHCLYQKPTQINAIVGVSGYLFPISKFSKQVTSETNFKRIIYGLADDLRPWEFTKMTYEGKVPIQEFVLIEGMKHEINIDTRKELKRFMNDLIQRQAKFVVQPNQKL